MNAERDPRDLQDVCRIPPPTEVLDDCPDLQAKRREKSDIELCRELLHYRRLYSGEWDVRVNAALKRVLESK